MMRQSLVKKVMSVILLITGLGWVGERSGHQFQTKRSEMGMVAASDQLQQAVLFLPSPPQPSLTGQLVSVPTGDSLIVLVGKQEMRVRLCGIDAPELSQPLGKTAQASLQKLLDQKGGQVQLMPVRQQGQWVVASVFVSSQSAEPQLVNAEMVENGLTCIYPPYLEECPYQQVIVQAEATAQNQQRGLWAKDMLKPWEHRRQQIAQALAQQSDPVQALSRFSPDYLRDGLQRTHLGFASWYGPVLNGQLTANGEVFNQTALTAAHPSLPFNTHLKVTNLENGKSVIVRINDHHPALYDSTLDLSQAAAEQIDSIESGVVPVEWVVLQGGR